MNSKYLLVIALVVLIIVLLAGYVFLNIQSTKSKTAAKNTTPTPTKTQEAPTASVNVTSSGFEPQTITVKKRTMIIWTNQSGTIVTVNSDDYPTNLLFPALNLGQFASGSNVSVMLTKAGTYTYHNQLAPEQKGKIVVQ